MMTTTSPAPTDNPATAASALASSGTTLPVQLLRYAQLVLHMAAGVATVVLQFGTASVAQKDALRQRWFARLLHLLGITRVAQGAALQSGALLVANHISWLDVVVLGASAPVRFVAKSEVANWPLIGWLARRNDTIFVARDLPAQARFASADIARALEAGHSVVIFPEGTTSTGEQVLHFRASLFQAALHTRRSVQPLALAYTDAQGQYHAAPAFVGQATLLQSLAAVIAAPALLAHLHPCAPLGDLQNTAQHDSGQRKLLAGLAQAAVTQALATTYQHAASIAAAHAAAHTPPPLAYEPMFEL